MSYDIVRSPVFDKSYEKLLKKNPVLAYAIKEKLKQIALYPEHFKPLRNEMKGIRRVHFGNYVLLYRFKNETVEVIDVDHHDFIY